MKKAITGQNIPKAVGPYSPAILCGNVIYTSGQLPIDPQTNDLVRGDITAVSKQIFNNIETILKKEGFSFKDIVKVTVYSASMAYFQEFNCFYQTLFQEPYPARTFIEAAKLPKDAELEVEVIAVKA